MYPAPLLHIHTHETTSASINTATEIDVAAITQSLLPLLRASSAFEPIAMTTNSTNQTDISMGHENNNVLNHRRILLFTNSSPASASTSINDVHACERLARNNARAFIPITLRSGVLCDSGRATPSSVSTVEEEDGARDGVFGGGAVAPGEVNEKELVLDVDGMTPEEVAGKIARWVWWVGEFMSWDD